MKFILIHLSLCAPLLASAQSFNANARTSGQIKTTQGKYEGTIDINIALDQVLWSEGNETKIFGARQIKQAKGHNENGDLFIYYGLELDGEFYLFEVITTGKIEVLYKEGILKNRYEDIYYPPFFILGKKKELISMERERDFLDAFGSDDKWMKQYIKNNNLSLAKKEDIQHAFSYYNNQYEVLNP